MREWLRPLVPLYRAGLATKDALRGAPRHLRGRVVSVGSLSAGGAGKTPVVMMVAEMLRGAGFATDVLSRGYGREGSGVELVDPRGSAARFGDEPVLLARRLGVPVWVGADRYAAGLAAEAGGASPVHVLDDGFQHRGLRRDVDVVLLTRVDVEDESLPAGNLREELAALQRATVVVLREEEAEELRKLVPEGKAVWVVRRVLTLEEQWVGKVIAFCGIARPEGFLGMLEKVGVVPVGTVMFKDHHRYGMRDVKMLAEMARLSGAGAFMTTEKDAVKLTGGVQGALEAVGPVFVAELRLELVEGSAEDLLRHVR